MRGGERGRQLTHPKQGGKGEVGTGDRGGAGQRSQLEAKGDEDGEGECSSGALTKQLS